MWSTNFKKKKKNLELFESKEGGILCLQVFWEKVKTDPVQLNKDGLSLLWKEVEEDFSNSKDFNQCILNKLFINWEISN